MANKNTVEKSTTEEVFDTLNNTASASEHFLEKYAKILGIIFGVLIVGALGYFAYLKYYVEPRNTKAFTEMSDAQNFFQKEDINAALNGSKGSYLGFAEITKEYSGTNAGNIATFYAGISEYKKGNFAKAIEYLQNFDTKEEAMKAIKFGAIGDAMVQSKKTTEALDYYVKAAEASDLEFTVTTYYKKAGILAMSLNKNKEALGYFKNILDKYPDSDKQGDIAKFVERLNNMQ